MQAEIPQVYYLFDKIFRSDSSDDYTIEQYVVLMVDSLYNVKELNDIVNNPISAYVEAVNKNRFDFAEYYLEEDADIRSTYINNDKLANITREIPLSHIHSIQEIKDKIDWYSMGLTALGFIPGVGTAVAIAFDAADLLYSYFADAKETKEINGHIEQFSAGLFKNYQNHCMKSVSEIGDYYQLELDESQNKLKNLFYEKF